MLGILILIGIGFWFSKMAQNHGGAKPWVWVVSGIGSYFLGQLIAGFIIGLVAPQMLDEMLTLILVGLITGILGVFVARQILITHAKNNGGKKPSSPNILDDQNDPLLDDDLLD